MHHGRNVPWSQTLHQCAVALRPAGGCPCYRSQRKPTGPWPSSVTREYVPLVPPACLHGGGACATPAPQGLGNLRAADSCGMRPEQARAAGLASRSLSCLLSRESSCYSRVHLSPWPHMSIGSGLSHEEPTALGLHGPALVAAWPFFVAVWLHDLSVAAAPVAAQPLAPARLTSRAPAWP